MWAWLLTAALANPELEQERIKVELLEERVEDARRRAAALLRGDDRSWFSAHLYLRACELAGLDDVCERELASFPDLAPVVAWHAEQPVAGDDAQAVTTRAWSEFRLDGNLDVPEALTVELHPHAARLVLRKHRLAGRDKELAAAALAVARQWSDHPQLLSELFIGRPAGKKSARIAAKLVRRQPDPGQDLVLLYRQLRLYMSAGEDEKARALAARIHALGEPLPQTHKRYNDAMIRSLARVLFQAGELELPPTTANNRVALALQLADLYALDGQRSQAMAVLEGAGVPDASLDLKRARVAHAMGDRNRSDDALMDAIAHTVAGAPGDVARRDVIGWRLEVAEVRKAVEELAAPPGRAMQLLDESAEGLTDESVAAFVMVEALLAGGVDASGWLLVASVLEEKGEHDAALLARTRAGSTLAGPSELWVLDTMKVQSWIAAPVAGRPEAKTGRAGAFPNVEEVVARLDRSQHTVVAIWASWCAPCRDEIPALRAEVQRMQDAGVAVGWLPVSVDRSAQAYVRGLDSLGLTDEEGLHLAEGVERLALDGVPTTFLVAPDLQIVGRWMGYDPKEGFVRLRRALAEVEQGLHPLPSDRFGGDTAPDSDSTSNP